MEVVEVRLVGGGTGRNSGELATVEAAKAGPVGRCGTKPRCEAAVDAAAVPAVEGDNDGDRFSGSSEMRSEEDEGRRCGGSETGILRRR
ncbi:hypothetical protein Syun_001937 [Stephania yunnanensis]|uniref:Uncharacterized protein n=1 Tax=Stephania yunnanensis TaxID=152371 RepID=A0AAP0LEK3_9MAGN